jgi:hypothetical protein
MSRRKQDPLRELTAEERQELARIARSQARPVVEGSRVMSLRFCGNGDLTRRVRPLKS